MKKQIILLTICLFSLGGFAATQDSLQLLFEKGNQFYQEKEYELAVEAYLQIEEQGYRSAELFYNIGNGYFKTNNIGKSILYYERALLLDPSNPDIAHNIAFANTQIVDKIESVPQLFITQWWEACASLFTADGWGVVGVVTALLLAFFVLAFLFFRSNSAKNIALLLAIITLIVGVFSFILGKKQLNKVIENKHAIVMSPIVNAKSTPSKSGGDLFVIHEGLKVTITDELNEWIEVQIPNGEKGWVLYQTIEKI